VRKPQRHSEQSLNGFLWCYRADSGGILDSVSPVKDVAISGHHYQYSRPHRVDDDPAIFYFDSLPHWQSLLKGVILFDILPRSSELIPTHIVEIVPVSDRVVRKNFKSLRER